MHCNKVKLICAIVLVSILLIETNECVTIEIQPDELEQIGEILIQSYMQLPSTTTATTTTRSISTGRSTVVMLVKAMSRGLLHAGGIMLTLVGASLLTTKLEPFLTNRMVEINVANIVTTTPTNTPQQICENDFGCDGNICWRTCESSEHKENEGIKPWCFTSPNPNETDHHRCIFAQQCSPCWTCISPCKF